MEKLKGLLDLNDNKSLELRNGFLINPRSGVIYESTMGIPDLTDKQYLTGINLKNKKRYDWFAFGYDISQKIRDLIRYGGNFSSARNEIFKTLSLEKGDRVLCVSIGDGRNLKAFSELINGNEISLYGLDISSGMLKKCKNKLKRLNLDIGLVQACAENIPFPSNYFDKILHINGFNDFGDKKEAASEMLRVVRPGGRVIIADETVPHTLIWNTILPSGIDQIENQLLISGKLYCTTFIKDNSK